MTTYDAVVLADTPTAFWKLTDGSGSTAADSSGNSHDGTATSVTFGETSPALPNGMSGTCASFDGTASDISSGSYQGPASGSFSAELWVNQDSLSQSTAFANFITTGNPSSYEAGFQIGVNFGSIAGSSGTGSSNVSVSDGSLEASGWTHLVLTFDGTDVTLYVNGTAGTPEAASAYSSATDSIHIGSVFGTGNFFTGFITRAAIYDYALTSTQVSDHYIAGLGIYVVQTKDGNSDSPTFDAEVAEHNAVVLIPIMYDAADVTSSNVKLGGSTVTGTTLLQHVTDTSICSHDIWILPDCPAGQTAVTFDVDGALDSVFLYEIAGLGPNPTADQVASAHRSFSDSSAIIGAGPTSPTVYENEIAIAASAAYNGGVDTEPDVWISPPRSDSDHGWSGYQVFSSSGATPSFAFINNEAWTAGIVTLAPAPSGVSASGAISLKKMVVAGASTEKAVVTGAISLKKMVVAGSTRQTFFKPVGDSIFENSSSFFVAPSDIGDLLFLMVRNAGDTSVWCTGVSSENVTWEQLGDPYVGVNYDGTIVAFAGKVTDETSQTVTVAFNGSPDVIYIVGQEFASSTGEWALDDISVLDIAGTDTWPSFTPDGPGELYVGYARNFDNSIPGSTPGYFYNDNVDGVGNGLAYNTCCDASTQAPVWGDSGQNFGVAVLMKAISGVSITGAITLKKMSVAAAVNAPSGLFNLFSNINMSGLACSPDANGYTLGTEFEVTTDGCSLKGVRFFSASGAIELPQQIGLYNVSGETLIQSQDASWDGDPATGWVTALFDTPIVLDPTAKYVLTAMQTEAVIWYTSGNHFWDTGLGSSGITNGPLSAPNLSASAGGQGLYDYASIPDMGFPASSYQGSTYWVDPVVDGPGTPSSPSESSVLSIFGGNLPDISVSAANDAPYNIGIQFIVTEDGCELAGYSWYVPDDGDVNGSDYDFALYTTTDGASGTIVDGSTVTGSGTWLTGTWNYTELETPVPLSTGVTYVAVGEIISVSGNTYQAVPDFWDTGAGASGIIAGPLTAPEASTAVGGYQQPYATSHVFPTLSYENSWYGIDVGVTQSSGVSASGAITLKKMVLSGVGVAPDIYVIQTMRSVGGTYSATFDDPISEHSTILICATGYTGDSITPVSSDPKLDDVFVSDAVQIIPDFWNASCGGTVWMLPDVEAGSPVISLDTNFGNNTENGAFFYEIANLGPNPQLDQFIVSNPHTGDSASFSISPITNRPEFVLGMYIQDGGNPPSGPGDGWNNSGLQGNWGGSNNGSGFYQIADTAGAEYSMAWTNDGVVNWSGVILSLMQGGPSASITGAIKLKKMVLAGVSHEKAVITGAVKLKKIVLAGVSHEKAVITGAVKLKKMVLSGASAEKAVVSGTVKLKKMVLAATVVKKPAITGTIKLKKMVVSGASHEKAVITGTITLKKMRVHGEEAKRKASTLFVFWPL